MMRIMMMRRMIRKWYTLGLAALYSSISKPVHDFTQAPKKRYNPNSVASPLGVRISNAASAFFPSLAARVRGAYIYVYIYLYVYIYIYIYTYIYIYKYI
jgi:hypothetical protein